jgi:hypothetical protein
MQPSYELTHKWWEQITDYTKVTDTETLDAIKEESLITLGYFLLPYELFSAVAAKGNAVTCRKSINKIIKKNIIKNHTHVTWRQHHLQMPELRQKGLQSKLN